MVVKLVTWNIGYTMPELLNLENRFQFALSYIVSSNERGFNPSKCNAVKGITDYVANDVKYMPTASQLHFLTKVNA